MDPENNEHFDENFSEEVIQQLRESSLGDVEAPSVERNFWSPKEINLKRSAWIVRGLIVFLLFIFFGEIYLLSQVQTEEPQTIAHFQGGPDMQIVAAPVVKAPMPAPPIAGADELAAAGEAEFPAPPTPTPPPLPPELQDVEIPPPDA
jgi:hypothetical protein